jgi:aerobic carbon-monoxide dehydrogenase large subunit
MRSARNRSGTAAPDNVALDQEFGDAAAVQAAFAAADLVVEQTFRNQRIVNCQMEPRSGVASYDPRPAATRSCRANQGVHVPRMVLAESFGLPPEKIRFVCPDVGGGFGLRNNLYPEQAAILWAAKRTGRPVKWTNDRSESFLTDYGGRDLVTTARLALNRDGKITAYDVDHIGTCGGHTVTYVPLSNAYRVATTAYDIPLMHMRCRSVMTNTAPTAPFRGAGRPEATLVLERLIDLAAARLGMDRIALRRKNLIAAKQAAVPHRERAALRQRRLHGQHETRARKRRLEGFPGAPPRIEEARKAARHRHLELCRDTGRHSPRARRSDGDGPRAQSSLRSAPNRPDKATRPRSRR